MEPLTEHRRVSGPVVYGFLRLVNVSTARQKALKDSLAGYCRQHELTLSGLFTERVTTVNSAVFTGLMDALEMPGTYGVVLPSASHLGPRAIATARGKRIAATGARLLLARKETPGPSRRKRLGEEGSQTRKRGHGPAPALERES
ncbi:hypothetical protein [Streptomyces telluris]|uniref:Resolvase/invertase-type recombinase catalytic domain-containing protein n=1 Tax=Streptomyces telluris TaxID=2720021 RepID=A0A9X2RMV6_9ACTN|nr:hypothetical protein [Streptomyces telluris]MCQ8769771.1 hypothetical protein [Streptomyces telluris]NJP79617.1 hypothetical protein [Streptomyces telluris]